MTQKFSPFMGTMENLTTKLENSKDDKKSYVVPALKNLGVVSIPIIREVISPASFRNEDATITDIDDAGTVRVRAVANKFKFGERARNLQILRYFNAGGACPQNKTEIAAGQTPGDVFDLGTIIFGDSTDAQKKVLPIKAAVSYSDTISIQDYDLCVDKTFHNRAFEDGTLFNAESQENSNNLFERHFIKPGTLLLQTLTFNGKTAPLEALEHLLLSIGIAGSYGGQTSIYGVNVRNHIVGIYAGLLERDLSSPYVAVKYLDETQDIDAQSAVSQLGAIFANAYAESMNAQEVKDLQDALIAKMESGDAEMRQKYVDGKVHIKAFFDEWFSGIGAKSDKDSKKSKSE